MSKNLLIKYFREIKERNSIKLDIIILFFIGLSLRFLYLYVYGLFDIIISPDSIFYLDCAQQFSEGNFNLSELPGNRGILTSLFLSLFFIFGDCPLIIIKITFVFIGSFIPPLISILSKNMKIKGKYYLISGYLAAISLPLIEESILILSDTINLILYLAIFIIYFSDSKKNKKFIPLLLSIAYINRLSTLINMILPFSISLILLFFLKYKNNRKSLKFKQYIKQKLSINYLKYLKKHLIIITGIFIGVLWFCIRFVIYDTWFETGYVDGYMWADSNQEALQWYMDKHVPTNIFEYLKNHTLGEIFFRFIGGGKILGHELWNAIRPKFFKNSETLYTQIERHMITFSMILIILIFIYGFISLYRKRNKSKNSNKTIIFLLTYTTLNLIMMSWLTYTFLRDFRIIGFPLVPIIFPFVALFIESLSKSDIETSIHNSEVQQNNIDKKKKHNFNLDYNKCIYYLFVFMFIILSITSNILYINQNSKDKHKYVYQHATYECALWFNEHHISDEINIFVEYKMIFILNQIIEERINIFYKTSDNLSNTEEIMELFNDSNIDFVALFGDKNELIEEIKMIGGIEVWNSTNIQSQNENLILYVFSFH